MSRSVKKTPKGGIAGGSEKQDKRFANRAFRRITNSFIQTGDYEKLPFKLREIMDVWSMAKDGKSYWHNAPDYYYRK